ncbi:MULTISPECIES: host specificity factor TipJ family phage tail protein [Pseudomonas]|uniref:host specificity factor TipJ family phage tail protein n=1 Tax=Pseudomonas TaxID=286 RepID=UPI0025975FF0|nr:MULTISPECIES: host specificity factor TipJ family phage tail protein [Pseudomonas]
MIEIYNKLEAHPLESYRTEGCMTLEEWLLANVKGYEPRSVAPITIAVNGMRVAPKNWATAKFCPNDAVRIYIEPKGDAMKIIGTPGPLAKLFGLGNPFDIKTPTQRTQQTGKDLNLASVKGNQAALNDIIPEIAGRRKRYPDYLLPARRYFGAPREQWIDMLLCVGKGKYQIPANKVLIGDTPIISLGSDVYYSIYQPGADLAGEEVARWWHSAAEVGSTSSGTAGLALTATVALDTTMDVTPLQFDTYLITAPSAAGWFPQGWSAGLIARIDVPQAWNFTSSSITGAGLERLAPFEGMKIEITGANAGNYVVASVETDMAGDIESITLEYDGGTPVTGLQTGTLYACIGYRGLRYRVTAVADDSVDSDDTDDSSLWHGPSSITVDRLTDTGATDEEWPGFDVIQSNEATIVLDTSTTEGSWAGPFAACPEGEVTNTIEVDLFFPQGLVNFNSKKGTRGPLSCTVEVQYRDQATAGAWTTVSYTFTASTPDQLGYTRRISLPRSFRPEVRVRRIGAQSNASDRYDAVQWYGLRSLLDAPSSYANVTVLAIRMRGGDRLASQSENQVSVEATRVLPVRNGGRWDIETPTRDIVPWVAHIARSIGYTDEDLDWDELDRLNEIWTARGDYYDQVLDSSSTVKSCLVEALQAGFAELTIDHGLIRPVRDEPRTTFEHMYTPQNMTEGLSRQFTALKPDDYDGVDVEYTDEKTWQIETIECRLDGDAGTRVDKLKLEGVTNATRAWRIGMRQRLSTKYRRWTYSFGTELDALNSRYLSYCAVADDVPGYGQSSILMGIQDLGGSLLLESSEPLIWGEGSHVVAIRRPDGTLSGPWPATKIDDYRLTIPELDFEPDISWTIEPPHMLFGTSARWSYPVLISSISPSGTESVSVEAMNYDDRVYTYDNASPR